MSYKLKSAAEINLNHINRTLKLLQLGKVSIKDCGLNKRFERLKKENDGWYAELYQRYVNIVREKALLSTS